MNEDEKQKEEQKQIAYRDARITGEYDKIWQSVGKCVFCDMRDKYVFYEENGVVMTVALFAYIDGNFMIIPRRHVNSVKDLTDLEWATFRKFMYIGKKIVREVHGIKALNYVLRDGGAGASSTVSDHIHMHVIPFDKPDLIKWNYRTLKFTPLENANLYKDVRKKIDKLGKRYDEKYGDE